MAAIEKRDRNLNEGSSRKKSIDVKFGYKMIQLYRHSNLKDLSFANEIAALKTEYARVSVTTPKQVHTTMQLKE